MVLDTAGEMPSSGRCCESCASPEARAGAIASMSRSYSPMTSAAGPASQLDEQTTGSAQHRSQTRGRAERAGTGDHCGGLPQCQYFISRRSVPTPTLEQWVRLNACASTSIHFAPTPLSVKTSSAWNANSMSGFVEAEREVLGELLECLDVDVASVGLGERRLHRVLNSTESYTTAVGPVKVARTLYRSARERARWRRWNFAQALSRGIGRPWRRVNVRGHLDDDAVGQMHTKRCGARGDAHRHKRRR